MKHKGVDISDNNGSVDFSALKQAGIEFVLIRCGYGGDYKNQDDGEFFANVRKAEAANMPWGAYLYSYALTTSQAISEAAHALRLLKQVGKPAYGVWFDMEDADHYKADHGMPSDETLVDICREFCDRVSVAGYYTGIYASLSWLENQLNSSKLDKYDKWVAQWNTTCDYKEPYGIWQFTNSLVISVKMLDCNYAYKDYPSVKNGEETVTYEQWKEYQQRYEKEQAAKKTSAWAEPAVEYCRENHIMSGDGEGSFRPQSNVTRQELAQVMMNLQESKA